MFWPIIARVFTLHMNGYWGLSGEFAGVLTASCKKEASGVASVIESIAIPKTPAG